MHFCVMCGIMSKGLTVVLALVNTAIMVVPIYSQLQCRRVLVAPHLYQRLVVSALFLGWPSWWIT